MKEKNNVLAIPKYDDEVDDIWKLGMSSAAGAFPRLFGMSFLHHLH